MNDTTNILDMIRQLESSGGIDKRAYTENKYGALGPMQIKRSTYTDLQERFPEKWGNVPFEKAAVDDTMSRDAANDYLKLISEYLVSHGMAPTREALLSSYHGGMGATARGTIGPNTREYLRRARALDERKNNAVN